MRAYVWMQAGIPTPGSTLPSLWDMNSSVWYTQVISVFSRSGKFLGKSENFEKCCVLDCFLKRSVVLPSFSGSLDDGFCARREGISIVRAHRENGRAAFQRTVGWHERTPVCETRSWVKFTGVHLLRVIPDVAHHGFRLPIDGHWVH